MLALAAAWRFLRGLPWQAWALVALLAAGWYYGHLRYNAGQADVQGDFDAYKAQVIAATEKSRQKAAQAESAQRDAFANIDTQYAKDKTDAIAKKDAVIAGLRAGTIRLRNEWACPTRLPDATSATGEPDGSAELRNASAGRIIGAGADADAQVRGLQAALTVCAGPVR